MNVSSNNKASSQEMIHVEVSVSDIRALYNFVNGAKSVSMYIILHNLDISFDIGGYSV